jgi:single-stranded DNA-specific DHH superfamily exonuclease
MTERPPSSPPSSPQSGSAPSSPLRSARPTLPFGRVTRATSPPPPPPPPPPSTSHQPPVRETGLIAWIEDIRATLRRENEAFRENLLRENEIWKANMQRELREEMRRLAVEKFIADNKPSSSSDTSSVYGHEEAGPLQPPRPPAISESDEPSPISPLTPTIPFPPESPVAGPSTMPPLPIPSTSRQPPTPVTASTPRRIPRLPPAGPAPFVLPRKPRIGSYYAVIVDTDGDDPDGTLLAHMIEIATFRPGFLFSHTGTPEPHRDCCATLYFATIGNVHDWMHDVNSAYRLDNQEIERLEQNSGELKRKRRFDMYVRICKVEAEDPWEIFERRR